MKEENEQHTVICSECGAVLTEQTASVIDGEIYCPDCLEGLTTTCDCCGRRTLRLPRNWLLAERTRPGLRTT